MKKLTALEIIERYGCVEAAEGKLLIHKARLMQKENMVEEIRARKEEILQTLREEKAKKQKLTKNAAKRSTQSRASGKSVNSKKPGETITMLLLL